MRQVLLGRILTHALCLTAFCATVPAHARVLVATNSTWRYFKGTSEASTPTNAWRDLTFDDSTWAAGSAPFHYGTNTSGGDDALTDGTILGDMRGNYTSVFLRQAFVIPDTNRLRGLRLNVWVDDGLAIWINGQPPRAPIFVSGFDYTNQATSAREGTRTPIILDGMMFLLRNGTNVLSLQAFNSTQADEDFRVEAELTETPSSLAFDRASVTIPESSNEVSVVVIRAGALDDGMAVDYQTVNVTASAGEDYVAKFGTLAFAQGQVEKRIVVSLLDDVAREPGEVFRVQLSNPRGGALLGNPSVTSITIADDDPGFRLEFADYWVQEDAGPVVFAVRRDSNVNSPAAVDFATVDGTAVAGRDYVPTNGTLAFATGERLKFVPVVILNDAAREASEWFTLSLTNPTAGVELDLPSLATSTIAESDLGVRFERTVHAVHEFEREVQLTVLRGNDVNLGPFTVPFFTKDDTAIANRDYVGTNGTLEFAEGEMQRVLAVRIPDDEILEPDRRFQVVLGTPSSPALPGDPANQVATVTVCDDTGWRPHRGGSLTVSLDGAVRLTLEGGVSARFGSFFDLYPVELSSNLVDWAPLGSLARTNASTNALVYVDSGAVGQNSRFYRLAATNLVVTTLPPTGPYAVGRVDRQLTNPAVRNRYGISTNGSFMVTIWYPAVAEAGRLPCLFDDPVEMHEPLWTDDPARNIYFLDQMPWLSRSPSPISHPSAHPLPSRWSCCLMASPAGVRTCRPTPNTWLATVMSSCALTTMIVRRSSIRTARFCSARKGGVIRTRPSDFRGASPT